MIGAVLIGGEYLYPEGYVSISRPACAGFTPEGCRLSWQLVPFEDGSGGDWQCVSRCRCRTCGPPTKIVELPPEPPQGDCPTCAQPVAQPTCPTCPPTPTDAIASTPVQTPAQAGQCEISIFAEASFQGVNTVTGEDQPELTPAGWANEISSIQVTSGTWDVFTEEQFTGNSMRLAPGQYPQLGPEWTKRINSFMCVQ